MSQRYTKYRSSHKVDDIKHIYFCNFPLSDNFDNKSYSEVSNPNNYVFEISQDSSVIWDISKPVIKDKSTETRLKVKSLFNVDVSFTSIYFTSDQFILSYIYWDFIVDITRSDYVSFDYKVNIKDGVVNDIDIKINNLRDFYNHGIKTVIHESNELNEHSNDKLKFISDVVPLKARYTIPLSTSDPEFTLSSDILSFDEDNSKQNKITYLNTFKSRSLTENYKISHDSLSIDYSYGASYLRKSDNDNQLLVEYLNKISGTSSISINITDAEKDTYAKLFEGHLSVFFYSKCIRSKNSYLENTGIDNGVYKIACYDQGLNSYEFESRFESIKDKLTHIFIPNFIELTRVLIFRSLNDKYYLCVLKDNSDIINLPNTTPSQVIHNNMNSIIDIYLSTDPIIYDFDCMINDSSLCTNLFSYIAFRNNINDVNKYASISRYYFRLYANIIFNLQYVLKDVGNKYDKEIKIYDQYIKIGDVVIPHNILTSKYNNSWKLNPDDSVMNNCKVTNNSLISFDDNSTWNLSNNKSIYGAKYGSVIVGRSE